MNELRNQVDDVIRTRNIKTGKEVYEAVSQMNAELNMLEICISFFYHYHREFDCYQWKDAGRARQLINQGLEMINNGAEVDPLRSQACKVLELLPDGGDGDSAMRNLLQSSGNPDE